MFSRDHQSRVFLKTMITAKEFEKLLAWVNEKPENRSIDITIGPEKLVNKNRIKIWVYDYELGIGELIPYDIIADQEHLDINLDKKKEDGDRKQYERLKQMFA